MPAGKTETDLPKLSRPALRALASANLTSLAKLARATEADVAALHGMGPTGIVAIKAALKAKGLSFAKR